MLVRKSFQFRLRPTKKQARLLQGQLDECRWLYNLLLEQRIFAHEELDISLTKYDQSMLIPFLKAERESLSGVHSQVLQNVVDRLDKSFKAFFRRCKAGEKPGFPRFRGIHRYNSFCFPQSGFSLLAQELKISKLGNIRIQMHRPIEGRIKTCTLRKNTSGDWNVSLSCEVNVEPLPPKEESIGIDVGLEHLRLYQMAIESQILDSFTKGKRLLLKHNENWQS